MTDHDLIVLLNVLVILGFVIDWINAHNARGILDSLNDQEDMIVRLESDRLLRRAAELLDHEEADLPPDPPVHSRHDFVRKQRALNDDDEAKDLKKSIHG